MDAPLVTVICLCHNHARFVSESIRSVKQQTYPHIQLIVVDDASADQSVEVIRETLREFPGTTFLNLPENMGNCKAFNRGLAMAKGTLVIDLAADDTLMPARVEEGVRSLTLAGEDYGVHFSDAELVNDSGAFLGLHSDRFPHATIPEGDIYPDLIERYFICSPTMMIRRSVFDRLGGYDETLSYEDFDFWVRSAREFKYAYSPKVLVRRRRLDTSLSRKQYARSSPQLTSTYQVCRKILAINRNPRERTALSRRIRYEVKMALALGAWSLAGKYFVLWVRNGF